MNSKIDMTAREALLGSVANESSRYDSAATDTARCLEQRNQAIRVAVEAGITYREIAEQCGVSQTMIWKIYQAGLTSEQQLVNT